MESNNQTKFDIYDNLIYADLERTLKNINTTESDSEPVRFFYLGDPLLKKMQPYDILSKLLADAKRDDEIGPSIIKAFNISGEKPHLLFICASGPTPYHALNNYLTWGYQSCQKN